MYLPGDQLLPRARLALDHDRHVVFGDAARLFQHVGEGAAGADNGRGALVPLAPFPSQQSQSLAQTNGLDGRRQQTPDGLEQTEVALLTAMGIEAVGLDELVRRTGVATGAAASAMTMLTLRGLVQQKPGNVFARKR